MLQVWGNGQRVWTSYNFWDYFPFFLPTFLVFLLSSILVFLVADTRLKDTSWCPYQASQTPTLISQTQLDLYNHKSVPLGLPDLKQGLSDPNSRNHPVWNQRSFASSRPLPLSPSYPFENSRASGTADREMLSCLLVCLFVFSFILSLTESEAQSAAHFRILVWMHSHFISQ